ncbi:unnamed protein product [Parnassius apollo]|uniref:(apollo) hypothetical protein n=1 Tax=Parnassius apollo TaxID=110799 RepID=A0A8S3YBK4_PARAO|nr:unnamed protein product [Parnassius apollo]
MNSWDNQYAMQNAMTMNSMMAPPVMQSNFMVQENAMAVPSMKPPPVPPLIGPVLPEGMLNDNSVEGSNAPVVDSEVQSAEAESSTHSQRRHSRDRGRRASSRDKREREKDRRHRSRSRDRNDRHDRGDRSERNDRNRHNRRDRSSKWESDRNRPGLSQGAAATMIPVGNMMIPGNMMAFNNMMPNTMMGQQQMDIQAQSMMPGMNMMPSMMSNVVDPNMMMMNQQMMSFMPNQQIYLSCGVLLPPLPGSSTPARRERPKGCRTIVVGGLPYGVTSEIVVEIFQRFGDIIEVKSPRYGIHHVRFSSEEIVEQAFSLSGYRFKFHDQLDNEATTIFIDYAVNREDENEYEKNKRNRGFTPPRVEPFTANALATITEKIKSEEEFANSAPTLAVWLERGECNKKNANVFYSLIQASNNQLRRLFNEKMQLDEEFQNLKSSMREKFARVVMQFEQVAKILSAAKHQRVSDHFTKQQRRNIEMWLKMTEEVENIKEEFNHIFEDDDIDKHAPNMAMVSQEKYDELKIENENLMYELEGYKNEAYLAKDEAERKFEKFKAHFIAQQALQNKQVYPPLPSTSSFLTEKASSPSIKPKPLPPPPTPDDDKVITSGPSVPPSEAKLISILTAFLMVHPLGASLDYLVSYVRSMTPNVTQATVNQMLQKYTDVFHCKTSGVGASIEHRWTFITFDVIKSEA